MRKLVIALGLVASTLGPWSGRAFTDPMPGVPGDASFDPNVQITKSKLADFEFDVSGFGATPPTPKTPAEAMALKAKLDDGIHQLEIAQKKLDAAQATVDKDIPTQAAFVAKGQEELDKAPKPSTGIIDQVFDAKNKAIEGLRKAMEEELAKRKRGEAFLKAAAAVIKTGQAKVKGELERVRKARAALMQSEVFQATDFQTNLTKPRYDNIDRDQVKPGTAVEGAGAPGDAYFVVNAGDTLSELAAKAFPDYPIYGPGGSLEAIMAVTSSKDGTLNPGDTVDLTAAAAGLGKNTPAGN